MAKKKRSAKKDHRREIFPSEYVIDYNGKEAAIRCGFAKSSAAVTAHRLLKEPDIIKAIEDHKAELKERNKLTVDMIVQEYRRIAFFDIGKVLNNDGTLRDISQIDNDGRAAIASIETDEMFAGAGESRQSIGINRKIKLNDKRAALQDLMRHMGGFEKDNAQLKPDKPLIIADIRDLPTEQKMKALQDLL